VWAVGAAGQPLSPRPLLVHWNGRAWRRVPAPRLPGASDLAGVAMTSARNGWAVGEYAATAVGPDLSGKPLILRWNGHRWTQVRSRGLGGGFLTGVAATSARAAWAVGTTRTQGPLIAAWHGTTWKRLRAPAGVVGVVGVAATSPRAVFVTGFDRRLRPVIIRWNGSGWRKLAVPLAARAQIYLPAIAASSARSAWAVGTNGRMAPAVYHWGGSAWRKVTAPVPDVGLDGVAARSGHDVWAAGEKKVGRHVKPGVIHWNGRAWTMARTPRLPGDGLLTSVAAISARSAWAVGSTGMSDTSYESIALILRWNGVAWKRVL
jgi:hypothetical protein